MQPNFADIFQNILELLSMIQNSQEIPYEIMITIILNSLNPYKTEDSLFSRAQLSKLSHLHLTYHYEFPEFQTLSLCKCA